MQFQKTFLFVEDFLVVFIIGQADQVKEEFILSSCSFQWLLDLFPEQNSLRLHTKWFLKDGGLTPM